jgi:UDP-glucose 6-dehydrogenase
MSEPYTQRAGYPAGFGGRCWPKDLAALIAASEDAGYAPEFLRAVSEANDRFTA